MLLCPKGLTLYYSIRPFWPDHLVRAMSAEGKSNAIALPASTASGSLSGLKANRTAKPIVARPYRAAPSHTGLKADRSEVRLNAIQPLGNNTTHAPSNMSREIRTPIIAPAKPAITPTNAVVVTTAFRSRLRVVAKGPETAYLAKINPAPLSCGTECR